MGAGGGRDWAPPPRACASFSASCNDAGFGGPDIGGREYAPPEPGGREGLTPLVGPLAGGREGDVPGAPGAPGGRDCDGMVTGALVGPDGGGRDEMVGRIGFGMPNGGGVGFFTSLMC